MECLSWVLGPSGELCKPCQCPAQTIGAEPSFWGRGAQVWLLKPPSDPTVLQGWGPLFPALPFRCRSPGQPGLSRNADSQAHPNPMNQTLCSNKAQVMCATAGNRCWRQKNESGILVFLEVGAPVWIWWVMWWELCLPFRGLFIPGSPTKWQGNGPPLYVYVLRH